MSKFSNRDAVQGAIDYVNFVKPFHSKLVEVEAEYTYSEDLRVSVTEAHTIDITMHVPVAREYLSIVGIDYSINALLVTQSRYISQAPRISTVGDLEELWKGDFYQAADVQPVDGGMLFGDYSDKFKPGTKFRIQGSLFSVNDEWFTVKMANWVPMTVPEPYTLSVLDPVTGNISEQVVGVTVVRVNEQLKKPLVFDDLTQQYVSDTLIRTTYGRRPLSVPYGYATLFTFGSPDVSYGAGFGTNFAGDAEFVSMHDVVAVSKTSNSVCVAGVMTDVLTAGTIISINHSVVNGKYVVLGSQLEEIAGNVATRVYLYDTLPPHIEVSELPSSFLPSHVGVVVYKTDDGFFKLTQGGWERQACGGYVSISKFVLYDDNAVRPYDYTPEALVHVYMGERFEVTGMHADFSETLATSFDAPSTSAAWGDAYSSSVVKYDVLFPCFNVGGEELFLSGKRDTLFVVGREVKLEGTGVRTAILVSISYDVANDATGMQFDRVVDGTVGVYVSNAASLNFQACYGFDESAHYVVHDRHNVVAGAGILKLMGGNYVQQLDYNRPLALYRSTKEVATSNVPSYDVVANTPVSVTIVGDHHVLFDDGCVGYARVYPHETNAPAVVNVVDGQGTISADWVSEDRLGVEGILRLGGTPYKYRATVTAGVATVTLDRSVTMSTFASVEVSPAATNVWFVVTGPAFYDAIGGTTVIPIRDKTIPVGSTIVGATFKASASEWCTLLECAYEDVIGVSYSYVDPLQWDIVDLMRTDVTAVDVKSESPNDTSDVFVATRVSDSQISIEGNVLPRVLVGQELYTANMLGVVSGPVYVKHAPVLKCDARSIQIDAVSIPTGVTLTMQTSGRHSTNVQTLTVASVSTIGQLTTIYVNENIQPDDVMHLVLAWFDGTTSTVCVNGQLPTDVHSMMFATALHARVANLMFSEEMLQSPAGSSSLERTATAFSELLNVVWASSVWYQHFVQQVDGGNVVVAGDVRNDIRSGSVIDVTSGGSRSSHLVLTVPTYDGGYTHIQTDPPVPISASLQWIEPHSNSAYHTIVRADSNDAFVVVSGDVRAECKVGDDLLIETSSGTVINVVVNGSVTYDPTTSQSTVRLYPLVPSDSLYLKARDDIQPNVEFYDSVSASIGEEATSSSLGGALIDSVYGGFDTGFTGGVLDQSVATNLLISNQSFRL